MTQLSALPDPASYHVTGSGQRPSAFAVSELANASVAAVGDQLAGLLQALNLTPDRPAVTVNQRLASLWFGYSFRPTGWEMPDLWDAIAGDYQTADGWIRLHTNLPHHRAAALRVLACDNTRDAVATAVRTWQGDALEAAIVEQGGVAAAMRSTAQWLAHLQGQAVTAEPLIDWVGSRKITLRHRPKATAARPLAGLRILDLTRVLAGPIATRTLAGFGAEVLRIDPPGWDEPGVIPDISLGKRCAYLDLHNAKDRITFEALLSQADVLVHGYRPGALGGLGYGADTRRQLAPNLIDVTLNAYGWTGPWSTRRGFDSLVQMSSGIAETGQHWAKTDRPTPLPVQALDHATGYLMAAAVLSALTAATQGEPAPQARLSLARTAALLGQLRKTTSGPDITTSNDTDYSTSPEHSGWGPGQRLLPPLHLSSTQMQWDLPAQQCGSDVAKWSD
ncbi:acyl-CoA transferase [Sedimentitalea sp. CY04]|uniref:Acyl-CoA transferase n=1 Tax=Parasedimentitalea denitrificans TaxID=2211118 RepID=A0ABX0W8N5_9RHOB|nr:CoA transferase [Sedimentitalea sp. CY04]NIZ62018.1 acyl-CoA transferase [Sedimentitalea sp. CY04]